MKTKSGILMWAAFLHVAWTDLNIMHKPKVWTRTHLSTLLLSFTVFNVNSFPSLSLHTNLLLLCLQPFTKRRVRRTNTKETRLAFTTLTWMEAGPIKPQLIYCNMSGESHAAKPKWLNPFKHSVIGTLIHSFWSLTHCVTRSRGSQLWHSQENTL